MDNKFEFKYTAPTTEERKEIEYIQSKYKPKNKEQTKIERLRALDNKVRSIPTMIALILGIVGLLIFGTGMTMVLEWKLVVWGVIVGIIGFVPMGLAYFSYNHIYYKLKNKYSEEILKLSSELLNNEK